MKVLNTLKAERRFQEYACTTDKKVSRNTSERNEAIK